jgi:hypothetical protein
MTRINLLVLCLAAALCAGCTGNKKTYLDGASVLAYWSDVETTTGEAAGADDVPGARCDLGLDCVAVRDNLLDFDKEVQNRRSGTPRMELVRFEAHRSGSGAALAGVWAKSDTLHDYQAMLDIEQFQAQHAMRSQSGQRLVHFAIWQDVPDYRIAAIWRHPRVGEWPSQVWKPDLVQFDLSWAALENPPQEGYYLGNIEVYPGSIAGKSRVAAVWRPGAVETKVLHGDHCSIRPDPLLAQKEPGNKALPCKITETSTSQHVAQSSCPVFQEIWSIATAAEAADVKSFLRPFDFEIYVEDGEDHLAVLLQERANRDWLMMPGSWNAVDCRRQLIDMDATLGFSGPRLLDLDLVSFGTSKVHGTLHEGVVHDSGTSGPPG